MSAPRLTHNVGKHAAAYQHGRRAVNHFILVARCDIAVTLQSARQKGIQG